MTMYDSFYILYSIGLIISIICIIGVALQKPSDEQKLMLLITLLIMEFLSEMLMVL